MKKIICKYCGETTTKYNREGSLFCNRNCYMEWKRLNPNRKAYKDKILISGYWYLYMPSHPNAIKRGRYIGEHRYVLEQKIGRLLTDNEVAHHINENTQDNRPENLEVLTNSKHISNHAKKRHRNKEGKFKDSQI